MTLATATRRHSKIMVGASPRGSLALMTIARAVAVIEGRDYVIPEDVKRVAAPVLAHRIGIKPELWLHKVSAVGIIEEILAVVPVPAEGRAGVRA